MNGYHTEFRPGTNWEQPRFQPGPLTSSAALGRQQPLFENNTPVAPLFGNFDSSRWNSGNVETPDSQTFALNRTFLPPVDNPQQQQHQRLDTKWNNPTDQPNMLLGHTTSQNPLGVSDFNIHDTQIPVDQSLIWRNPNPKRMAPPDKGTSLWGDPDHHATIEIKRWKTYGDDVVDARSQAAVAAAAGSTFYNQQQQQSSNLTNINNNNNNNTNDNHVKNDDQDDNDINNSDQFLMAKESRDQNGCVISTNDNRLSTINDENLTIDTIEKNIMAESGGDAHIDSSCKSETSSVRDETSSSVLDDVKLRWGPVVSNSNDGSPWSSALQTEDSHGNAANHHGGSSLDNTSSDSVFSSINANNSNEISSSLINSIKDQNAHLNFAPAQKLLAGSLAPKDVEEKAEEYKMRLLSLVNRGYVELNSLGRLYEQENTVILLNNMMQICQQLDDLCQRQQQLQMPQQKVLYDRLTNCEIPRLQTALQTLKEQIYAVCNTNSDNNASPRKSGALWNTDTPDQQNTNNMARSFFSGHQPLRSVDSNSWSSAAATVNAGDYQQNLVSPSCNWSSMKHKSMGGGGGFLDFGPNANVSENFDSAFGGLSLSEFRPGTKWEPPRQQSVVGGGALAPAVSRPQSMFKNNGPAAAFGAFDKIIGSGFDGNAPSFLTPTAGGNRPPSWNTTLTTAPPPVFRAPPQQQQQPQSLMASQSVQQQLPWFVLSKVNKNVNEAHLKMFLNNFGRIQAFYYWQPPGFALFQFSDMPSPETAQLLQQRLYSQGITLTLHKQAEAEKIAEAMSSAPHGRAAAPLGGGSSTSFAPSTGAQSSFFDNSMLYNKFP